MLFVLLFVYQARAKVQHMGMMEPASGAVLIRPVGPERMLHSSTCGYWHGCVVHEGDCRVFSINGIRCDPLS